MERTLGKARILTLYLNTVDWGPGLCGARDAARRYFGREPGQLTLLQAAWLAGILRDPHVQRGEDGAVGHGDRRAGWVVDRMAVPQGLRPPRVEALR